MTRKDYELLARYLGDSVRAARAAGLSEGERDALAAGALMAAGHVADALATDNDRFDRKRFMNAVDAARKEA